MDDVHLHVGNDLENFFWIFPWFSGGETFEGSGMGVFGAPKDCFLINLEFRQKKEKKLKDTKSRQLKKNTEKFCTKVIFIIIIILWIRFVYVWTTIQSVYIWMCVCACLQNPALNVKESLHNRYKQLSFAQKCVNLCTIALLAVCIHACVCVCMLT